MANRRAWLAGLMIVAAVGTLGACTAVRTVVATVAGLPTNKDILFWTDPQRSKAFRMMDSLTDAHVIKAGGTPYPLPPGAPLAPA